MVKTWIAWEDALWELTQRTWRQFKLPGAACCCIASFCAGARMSVHESLRPEEKKIAQPLDESASASSTPASVVEVVQHGQEAPAQRDAQLLEEQADHDWADNVEQLIQRQSHLDGEPLESVESDRVFLYPYKRAPAEFVESLLNGPQLKPIRDVMIASGCPHILEEGTKIFVWPNQYNSVLLRVREQGISLRASHVIASESILHLIEASIADIPSQKNVRVKKDAVVELTSASGASLGEAPLDATDKDDSLHHIFQVERTFICVTQRVLRSAHSVNQSKTEVHGGLNPRRLV